jgi:hypothetical protein
MNRFTIAILVLVGGSGWSAQAAAQVAAQPQPAAPDDWQKHVYGSYVVVENASSVPKNAFGVAAQILSTRAAERREGDPHFSVTFNVLNFLGSGNMPGTLKWGDTDFCWLQVTSQKPAEPEEARQAWQAAREELEEIINSLQQLSQDAHRRQQQAQIEALSRHRDELQQEVQKAVGRLIERRVASGGPRGQFEQAHADMQKRVRELQLRRIGADARREAIEKLVDQLRATVDKRRGADPLLEEFRRIVKIRQQRVEVLKAMHDQGGAITMAELQQGEAELAMANVELLKAERSVGDDGTSAMLGELNNQLSQLSVESAELEAQLEASQKMLSELNQGIAEGTQFEAEAAGLEQHAARARQQLSEIEARLAELYRDAQISVTGKVKLVPLETELDPSHSKEAEAKPEAP